ncbi:MAG: hypothetical protein WEC59_12640 [Salibacteraceae bacterium]
MRRTLLFIAMMLGSICLRSQAEINDLINHLSNATNYGYDVVVFDCSAGKDLAAYSYFINGNGNYAVDADNSVYFTDNRYYVEVDRSQKTLMVGPGSSEFFTPPKIEPDLLNNAQKQIDCEARRCTLELKFNKENARVTIAYKPESMELESYRTQQPAMASSTNIEQCVEMTFKPLTNKALQGLSIDDFVKMDANKFLPTETYSSYEFFDYTQR